ncbi:MAG: hypothetical protein AAFN80_02970 [Pseudomonadota bacterium]
MKLSFGPKRLVMTSGVLICALGTGYVMQNVLTGGENQTRSGVAVASVSSKAFPLGFETKRDFVESVGLLPDDAQAISDIDALALSEKAGDIEDVQVDEVILTSALPAAPVAAADPIMLPSEPVKIVASSDAPISDLPVEEKAPAFTCEIELTATPDDAAMTMLALEASCMTNERFTLHHSGMMISGITDENGEWRSNVPALAENALFIAAFPNGEGAVANAQISDLSAYERYVVQWKGDTDVQMHAFENGATYEDAGHVRRGTSKDILPEQTGFLTRFAEDDLAESLNAEIYTFPSKGDGDTDINIEIEVGDATCGQDLEAQALIMSGAGGLEARDLMIAMPDCGAVGEFLVLKNLYEDLTIARN